MKNRSNYISGLLYMLLTTLLLAGMSSCYVEQAPTKKMTIKKSHPAHPHGGPPGQTKKANGHPGKRH